MADLLTLRTLFRPTPPRTSGPAPLVATSTQPRVPAKPPAPVVARALDLFEASPSKPKLVDLGGGDKPGTPVSPYPPTKDILRYQAAQQRAPRPEQYPNLHAYNHAYEAHQRQLLELAQAAGEDYLGYIEDAAEQTPTGNSIVDAAREAGVEVVVLPDAEYARRYPDTRGVTSDGTVYVPVSSIDDPSDPEDVNVVVHEYVHALLGDKLGPGGFPFVRQLQAAQTFASLGLPPEAGVAVAQQTAGWEDSVAIEHVVTAYITRRMERERLGLPTESPEQEAAAIERIADRELALHFQRNLDGDHPVSDAELVAQWENTPTGQRHPPEGDTVEEQAAWIQAQLPTLAAEEYVDPPPPFDKLTQ
jgi:hypothetical protein